MLTWIEVAADHKTQAGVSIKNKKINSILLGDNKYKNSICNDNTIEYIFKAKGIGKYWHNYFLKAVKEKYTLTVYKKEETNCWIDLGKYKAISLKIKQDDVIITLNNQ